MVGPVGICIMSFRIYTLFSAYEWEGQGPEGQGLEGPAADEVVEKAHRLFSTYADTCMLNENGGHHKSADMGRFAEKTLPHMLDEIESLLAATLRNGDCCISGTEVGWEDTQAYCALLPVLAAYPAALDPHRLPKLSSFIHAVGGDGKKADD